MGGIHGGVDDNAVVGDERRLAFIVGQIVAGFGQRLHGVDDRQAELDREIVIALVAARHGHDGAGAVVHEHVIRGEQRQLGSGDRIGGVQAGEQAGLLASLVDTVLGGLGFRSQAIGLHCLDRSGIAALPVFRSLGRPLGGNVFEQVMLRGDHGERGAEQGVGTGGVDLHVFGTVRGFDLEMHGSAVGFADPIALHELDLLRPVDAIKIFDQTVAVCGDAHGPLAQLALEHREVAAFGLAFGGDLLVGEHRAQLAAHVGDVLLGGDARMLTGLDRILLGRQAEGVIAHGVQHVLALHTVVAADHIGGKVAQRVTHMQALARRIREHVHREIRRAPFGVATLSVLQIAVDVSSPESAFVIPNLLPFSLNALSQIRIVTERRLGWFVRLRLRAFLNVTHNA